MKKNATYFLRDQRGATLVEYALVLFAILILVAGAFKALGAKTGTGAIKATGELK